MFLINTKTTKRRVLIDVVCDFTYELQEQKELSFLGLTFRYWSAFWKIGIGDGKDRKLFYKVARKWEC